MKDPIYPIGEQSFREIRRAGKVYVDKTSFIPLLLRNKFHFLSRPRRFGKSLFLSTLENFFLGHRELFKGLYIDSYDWNWQEYPVIRINLGEGSYSKDFGLEERLNEILEEYEIKYDVQSSGRSPRARFRSLLKSLYLKYERQVVILIDEYEKPLLDTIEMPHFQRYQDELADFYSVLKSNEETIKFLFITGVTRFGHLNIFSGFNNLNDISLDDDFSSICGITTKELLHYFRQGIEIFANTNKIDIDHTLNLLKKYYDGYHFSRQLIDVYNPFSLLSCFFSKRITSIWFQSGSSRYLLNNLKKNNYDLTDLEGVKANEDTLKGVDASMKDSVTLLYQSGYLTIKNFNPESEQYTLGLPNFEVKRAIYSVILPYYLGAGYNNATNEAYGFIKMLKEGKAEEAMEWLQGYFSGISQDVKLDYESEFQQVVYAFFALSGQLSGATLEKKTSNGRIDMVYETERFVYVFEFKRGEDAQVAMDQINSKQYGLQWQADNREVIKIGVAFSPKTHGIAGFVIER